MGCIDFPYNEFFTDDSLRQNGECLAHDSATVQGFARESLQAAQAVFIKIQSLFKQMHLDNSAKSLMVEQLVLFWNDYWNGICLLNTIPGYSMSFSDFDCANLNFFSNIGKEYAFQLQDFGAFVYFSYCLRYFQIIEKQSDFSCNFAVWN